MKVLFVDLKLTLDICQADQRLMYHNQCVHCLEWLAAIWIDSLDSSDENISKASRYLDTRVPSLAHQRRPGMEDPGKADLNSWYARGQRAGLAATNTVKVLARVTVR